MTIKVMLSPRGDRCVDIRQHRHIDSNVAGSISWSRLSQQMRAMGEIKADEVIEAFVIDDSGIQYYVRRA